jgi:hypothetical protein
VYNLASPPTPPPGQENVIFFTLKVAAHDTCEVNLVVSSITIYKIYDVYCGIYYIKITTSQIRNMGGEFLKVCTSQ